jgi:hypothetical protein
MDVLLDTDSAKTTAQNKFALPVKRKTKFVLTFFPLGGISFHST